MNRDSEPIQNSSELAHQMKMLIASMGNEKRESAACVGRDEPASKPRSEGSNRRTGRGDPAYGTEPSSYDCGRYGQSGSGHVLSPY